MQATAMAYNYRAKILSEHENETRHRTAKPSNNGNTDAGKRKKGLHAAED